MNVLSNNPGFVAEGIQRATFIAVTSIEKLIETVRQKHNYRRTVIALSALDDRELSDIGLIRSDIKTIAKRSYH